MFDVRCILHLIFSLNCFEFLLRFLVCYLCRYKVDSVIWTKEVILCLSGYFGVRFTDGMRVVILFNVS